MAVTLLVWLTSAADKLTEESKQAMEGALGTQADWVRTNIPTAPKDRESRGAVLFQQVEDPRVALETSQWESLDQHNTWLASEEYKNSSVTVVPHFDFSKLEYFYLDGSVFAAAGNEAQETPLLKSPVISVSRMTVASAEKEAFIEAWAGFKGSLETFAKPHVVQGGWRAQQADQDTDEFVIFCGWPTVEKHLAFGSTEDFPKYGSPLLSLTQTRDAKHYHRVL
ncbi:Uu.00g086450.m01.CDS01 [Anthostomella pinea]|uniref:Uu.00g086450.m01.CDS01 n=1 Tax=Anthostomella pinea TaxID=933095 RepID=A0AAI8VM63_9PEZI|nr:Uu.00g086450.m01.CDS01 [Anthostomella pinea]